MSKDKAKPRGRKQKSKSKLPQIENLGEGAQPHQNETQNIEAGNRGCISSSIDDLVKHYEDEFLNNPKYSYITMKMHEGPDKHFLMKIYKAVTENGGFKEVLANSNWKKVQQDLKFDENSIQTYYRKYLFHYEKLFNEATALKLNYRDDFVAIEDLDPDCL